MSTNKFYFLSISVFRYHIPGHRASVNYCVRDRDSTLLWIRVRPCY